MKRAILCKIATVMLVMLSVLSSMDPAVYAGQWHARERRGTKACVRFYGPARQYRGYRPYSCKPVGFYRNRESFWRFQGMRNCNRFIGNHPYRGSGIFIIFR